jgi:glycosyltransferase involved in cell wall biosynthesis
MSSHKPFVVACIPAYNEEKTIAKVLLKTKKYVDKVIVCDDDGSTDMTAEIAEALGAEVIRHERTSIG